MLPPTQMLAQENDKVLMKGFTKAQIIAIAAYRPYTHAAFAELQCILETRKAKIQGGDMLPADNDSEFDAEEEEDYHSFPDDRGASAEIADFFSFSGEDRVIIDQEQDLKQLDLEARLRSLNKPLAQHRFQVPTTLNKLFGSNSWKIFEATYVFISQLKDIRSGREFKYALAQYLIAVTGKSIASLMSKIWNRYATFFTDLFGRNIQGGDDEEKENPFTKFSKFFSSAKATLEHPILRRLRTILHYTLGLCLLERFGVKYSSFMFSKAEEEASKKQYSSGTGFLMSVLEGGVLILERLWDVYKTGSWSPLLHNGDSYAKWTEDVYLLKEHAQMLHNPQANGFTFHDFISRLDDSIEKGDAILKYTLDMANSEKTLVKKLLSELRLIKADNCTKRAARKARDAPFSMLLNGGSSVGKSSLIDILYYTYANLHNLPIGDDYMYTRTFSDEYWSGFTSSAWMIVLDDVAAKNPELQDDPSMNEIIQIVNRTPTVPPQADLADKGRTPLRPEFVLATTNTKDMNAKSYYCNPLAIARRFPMVVTAYPKEEYCVLDHGTVPRKECRMLDSRRVPPQVEGVPPDLWDFEIEKVEAIPDGKTQAAKYTRIHSEPFVDIFYVLKTMGQMSKAHKLNQAKVSTANDSCKTIMLCPECCNLITRCECDKPPTVEEEEKPIVPLYPPRTQYPPTFTGCGFCGESDPDDCLCVQTNKAKIDMLLGKKNKSGDIQGYTDGVPLFIGTAALYGLWKVKGRSIKKQVRQFLVETGSEYVADVTTDCVRRAKESAIEAVENTVNGGLEMLESIRQTCRQAKFTFAESIKYELEQVRDLMRSLGERVRENNFISRPMIYSLIISVPLVIAGWHIYKNFFSEDIQGHENGKLDVKDEKQNPWVNNDYKVSEFELGRLTKSWKGLTEEKVVSMVARNTLHATYRYVKERHLFSNTIGVRTLRIVALGGDLYMTNAHNLVKGGSLFDLTITMDVGANHLQHKVNYWVYEHDVYYDDENDLAFFTLKSAPPKSSIIDLFPSETFQTHANGFLINRDENGQVNLNQCRNIRNERDHISSTCSSVSDIWTMSVARDTEAGECGTICLGFAPSGPFIGGIHVRGGHRRIADSIRVTKEMLEKVLLHFNTKIIQGCPPDLSDKFGNEMELLPLHFKSPFRYVQNGCATVFGSLAGFRGGRKSKVGETYICQAMVKRGCKVWTGAPDMTSYRPWYHAARDKTDQVFHVKESLVQKCADSFAKDILAGLSQADLDELIILCDGATVNGQPGVQFIDKMKRDTSMGFPWCTKKSNYLSAPVQFDIWEDYVEFPEEVMRRTRSIEESYRAGFRAMPIMTSHLKDEARKLSKCLNGETREFTGVPVDFAFVIRKHLLTSVRMIQKNRILCEAAPGLNTTSYAWDELYHYLTQFGEDQMIAGDFKAFDKKMAAVWIRAAFDVLIQILEVAGWTEDKLCIVRGIAIDIAFPLCHFNGDLVQFWGSNPSGHPLTVIINCIVNCLYMRYVWHEIGYELSEFKKYVALMTYGDDNAMGVSKERPLFNHTSIQAELAKIGVTYTMADKEAESVPYINMKDITFLKRSWRFEPEVESYVAPLDETSIHKSLTTNIPSKEVCPEQQGVDLMHGALREYWFYGREVFDQKRQMFLEVIDELDLMPFYTRSFTTYDEIRNEYLNSRVISVEDPELSSDAE